MGSLCELKHKNKLYFFNTKVRKKQLRFTCVVICIPENSHTWFRWSLFDDPRRAVASAFGLGACYSETEIAVTRLLRVCFCLLNIKLKKIQIYENNMKIFLWWSEKFIFLPFRGTLRKPPRGDWCLARNSWLTMNHGIVKINPRWRLARVFLYFVQMHVAKP